VICATLKVSSLSEFFACLKMAQVFDLSEFFACLKVSVRLKTRPESS